MARWTAATSASTGPIPTLTYGDTNSGTAYAFESCNDGRFGIAGHMFSRGNAPAVSGYSGTALQVGSTDLSGTIIEGSSCTGAAVAFAQPYSRVEPFCVVMPWNGGTTLTAYNATSTQFTLTQASASSQRFTYRCMAQ